MIKPIAILLGGILLSPAFVPTLQAAEGVDSVVVNYADLDLGTPAGTSALYHRIRRAASIVCPDFKPGDVRHIRIWRPCYNGALAEAVGHIDMPALTSLYHDKTRAPFARSTAVTQVTVRKPQG